MLNRIPGNGTRVSHAGRRRRGSALRSTGLRAALLAGMLAASLGLSTVSATAEPAQAAAGAAFAADDFFVPPAPLPDGVPGDIIRSRPAKAGPPTARSLADAWQVMYLSTNALGEPNAVTGMVLVPKGVDPAAAPVIGFAPGTHGPAFKCAPSNMINNGAFYEQPGLNDLLAAGYAVAVTDYEGYHPEPATTYVVGAAMGSAVIDGVRAAQRLPEANLSAESKVAFRGYSQGGGAAMWAGELQPQYAPELDLVGVAGGGVPADLIQVALQLDGTAGFGVLAYAFIGVDNAYPDVDLDAYLNDRGRDVFAEMVDTACTLELLTTYANTKINDLMERSPVLEPEWLEKWEASKLGTNPIEVPVLQYHATSDELVQYGQGEKLRKDYCAQGVDVTWKTFDSGHIGPIYHGNADVLTFLEARMAGDAPEPNC